MDVSRPSWHHWKALWIRITLTPTLSRRSSSVLQLERFVATRVKNFFYLTINSATVYTRHALNVAYNRLTNEVGYIALIPRLPWFIVDNHSLALALRPRISWWLSTINHGNRGITITYPLSLSLRCQSQSNLSFNKLCFCSRPPSNLDQALDGTSAERDGIPWYVCVWASFPGLHSI